ncbi:unnamed protein product [Linum tenue]|uniref:Uncharacterized protein n=1 Tax=Linum tenue TaxID=586396 RepID=A0AAV0HRA6_9ROSI|nr:unnamed protein product [Linum tenue]
MGVTQEEFTTFHSIDRDLYVVLSIALCRDPMECMQIMAFWLWLERICPCDVVYNILSLPWALINDLAEEASLCLSCINSDVFIPPPDNLDVIPLTVAVLDKDYISLPYFFQNRFEARKKIAQEYSTVCVRALSDIMQKVIEQNAWQATKAAAAAATAAATTAFAAMQMPSASFATNSPKDVPIQPVQQREQQQQQGSDGVETADGDDRTMFATFSKGYPIMERELREFLVKNFGSSCIESLHMHEAPPPKQSLYAKIIFRSATTVEMVLKGMHKAKFSINGKHVWVRKFIPYKNNSKPSVGGSAGASSSGTAVGAPPPPK